MSDITNPRVKKLQEILRIANDVVNGYKFKSFDYMLLEDQMENAQLTIDGKDVFDFNRKRLAVDEVVQAPANYF